MYAGLTKCEQLVMKTVWDANEELGLMDIVQRVNAKYQKEWAPQTVSTLLTRLIKKGYLSSYRSGRVFYYRILIPYEAYKAQSASEFVKFWNNNNANEFVMALMHFRPLRQDEVKRLREMLKL